MKLRSRLALVVLVAVIPFLLFSGAMLRQAFRDQRAVLDQGMRDTARALSLGVDGEVKASRAILGTLAASPSLDSGDLGAFYELCVRTMAGRTNAYVILFDPILDPSAGPLIGDPDRLQQVTWNLLTNAVKFTPKRGRVQVHLQRVNSHVEIVVSDTGQGISGGWAWD
jgi:signal transduction histidine kinase